MLEVEGKLETRSQRTHTIRPRKEITLSDGSADGHQRVRLAVADGGAVYFYHASEKKENGSKGIEFSGVLDRNLWYSCFEPLGFSSL